jgi:hypothetical protein
VRATDWLAGSDLFAKFTAPPVAAVSGAAVTQVADLLSDSAVTSIQVSDTADALSGALSDLNGQATITEVVVQDSTNPLAMTGADFASSTALLAKVRDGDYSVALSDVGAASAAALASNTHVTSMDVSDSSANVTTNFDALAAATNLNSIAASLGPRKPVQGRRAWLRQKRLRFLARLGDGLRQPRASSRRNTSAPILSGFAQAGDAGWATTKF